jgi:hypothetical protein
MNVNVELEVVLRCANKLRLINLKPVPRTRKMAGNDGTDFLRDLCFDANLANHVDYKNSYVETPLFNAYFKALYTAVNR